MGKGTENTHNLSYLQQFQSDKITSMIKTFLQGTLPQSHLAKLYMHISDFFSQFRDTYYGFKVCMLSSIVLGRICHAAMTFRNIKNRNEYPV